MLNELKALNLTEADFKLMVKGLDSIARAEAGGSLMVEMLTSIMDSDRSEEATAKKKAERDRRLQEIERKQEFEQEEVKILQGKLLSLKRYLQANAALADTYDVIHTPPPFRPVENL